jgi:DnaJ-class molecular chaperone
MTTPSEVKEYGVLFLKRDVQDEALIAQCKTVLDNWSNKIPFCPIKKLGSKTDFISATEFATYKTTVTTQIEKRWLKDNEVPYQGQPLPSKFRPGSEFDPWKMSFPRLADFASHHNSRDLAETCQLHDCSHCHARGQVDCPDCKGEGQFQCKACGGDGYNKCWKCNGSKQIRKTKIIARHTQCRICSGRGLTLNNNHCNRCNGRGTEIKNVEEEDYVTCDRCDIQGNIPCRKCDASGKVPCKNCGCTGKITCSKCKGAKRFMTYVSAWQFWCVSRLNPSAWRCASFCSRHGSSFPAA